MQAINALSGWMGGSTSAMGTAGGMAMNQEQLNQQKQNDWVNMIGDLAAAYGQYTATQKPAPAPYQAQGMFSPYMQTTQPYDVGAPRQRTPAKVQGLSLGGQTYRY
jgi:hypothetical protein